MDVSFFFTRLSGKYVKIHEATVGPAVCLKYLLGCPPRGGKKLGDIFNAMSINNRRRVNKEKALPVLLFEYFKFYLCKKKLSLNVFCYFLTL